MFGMIDGTGFNAIDPSFDDCLIGHARVERLWTGARWSEGPVWFAAGRYLLWSDIPNNRILRWDDTDGSVSTFRQPSNNSNGHSVDRQGRLVSCEHLSRRVTRTEPDGSITVIADSYQGKRLNSPNDVVVKSDGSSWFTDPSYGIMMDYEGRRAPSEIGACHVYRVDPNGDIRIVADDYVKPNGLAFSPDETQLYIADTGGTHMPDGPAHIRRHSVAADGTLSGGDVFATCDSGFFDGFRLDTDGRIWTSAADGVHCLSPDGKLLGKILIPEFVANVCFGGEKLNRLFICGTTSLYSVFLNVNGVSPYGRF
ncbi:SMP-30/gluconolactonase/LRE family protein [Roseobacter denitrificans]|uniref:Gluconolactonase, putative n=1 Tax=Roseobacter denitrificans (strain ATCC 33942 / OCh 114) TaxID=375451 RepID=Q162A5_ROSDO|nr:SMP-30/gluconolactonase/LRE family protein [Roseobacter denitrificans]ABG33188.1 gluconolactonase, putative [Roseobacter denitrificans OCh 114]AVL52539.1 SMP-30/gluconolactonase/LRE family protein [Roseobacter denitrificans]SFG29638.1 gluconolactonase [Roseobacter denitrificans OCh 114]